MKYLKKFSNHNGYDSCINTDKFIRPNVSICKQENDVHYNPTLPHDYYNDYLTIESLEDDNTISLKTSNSSLARTISISTDNGTTWIDKTSTTSGVTLATLNTGNKLIIKGTNTSYGNSSYYNYFGSTKEFNVEGNIMSLLYGDNFENQTELTATYTLKRLFNNCTKLKSAENLILPATALTNDCYTYMFYGCTRLTTAPELHATILTNYCYNGMFYGCTRLTTAPKLPATTLAQYCYNGMFNGCTLLTTAPELPATTLATNCYQYMFRGCTALTTAPELPATTLATNCYSCMFQNCTSLVTAPELPATALTNDCYTYMFSGCTSLTTAPDLPATTLRYECYKNMFNGCTSLNYIKCLATSISATDCTTDWITNVAASGTFIKAASANWSSKTGSNGIPSGWTVQDYVES